MEGAEMLKKTALSLFGLAVMLICFNPPQADAGVVVSFGSVYPRPVYVRPYRYVAPVPYVAYRPDPYFYAPTYVRPGWGYIVRASTPRVTFRGMSIACSWNAVRTGGGNSS
jgi:hypothetical protein